MKKFTIVFTILAILIVMISCRNEPEQEQVVYFEPEKEEVVWTEIQKESHTYDISAPKMSNAKIVEGSFMFRLQLVSKESVTYDSALGSGDFELLEISGNSKIARAEYVLHYFQPDEGLGERNWHIAFTALIDEFSDSYNDPQKRESALKERPAPNQTRMYIYNAHGVDGNGCRITDDELGWKAGLLNGWLAVEYSNFTESEISPDPVIDSNNHTKTYYTFKEHYWPKSFSLTATDISDMSEETRKLSSLPALDMRMVGEVFDMN